jgi:AcrR family transcriptional regulator
MTTRSAVLAAAARLIEKEGVAGLSVREAARRAGVSHNAPYRHFRDRDSLLAGLAEEGAVLLERALEGRSGRALGEAYVRFALAHPQRFRLMFRAGARSGMVERFAVAFANVSEARVAGLAAWSLVHGLAELAINGCVDGGEIPKILGAMRFAAQRSA